MNQEKHLTCISCPVGCRLTVTIAGDDDAKPDYRGQWPGVSVGADGNPPASEELGVRSEKCQSGCLQATPTEAPLPNPSVIPHSLLLIPHARIPNPESRAPNPDAVTVTGNLCPRGVAYAKSEITNPVRMVTSTVQKKGDGTVSVKTSAPVKKAEIFLVLSRLSDIEVAAPVEIGDIIVKDVLEGIHIVATQRVVTGT